MARPGQSRHREPVRPLTSGGWWVQVDGRPICATCGRGLVPTGVNRWRHAPPGSGTLRRSRWLTPPVLDEVLHQPTYEAFGQRFPWAVRADFGGPTVTGEADWREGVARLRRYRAALEAARARPGLVARENPYLELFALLSAPVPEAWDGRPTVTPAGATGIALGASGGRYADADWPLPPGLAQMLHLRERRRELASLFSWAVPTADALDALAAHAPLSECGAGSGYWAALLRLRDVDVVACDRAPQGSGRHNEFHAPGHAPWTAVTTLDSVAAARRHSDRALLLCFPPHGRDDASYGPLRAYRGDTLVYVGEGPGGSTGSIRFHRELALNWTRTDALLLPRWPGLRDSLAVYRRNQARRPLRERDRCGGCGRFVRTGLIGRCDACFTRHPPALALRVGEHRVEYAAEDFQALPDALRRALAASPSRIL